VVLTTDRARALVEVNRKLAAELKQQALDAAIHRPTSTNLTGPVRADNERSLDGHHPYLRALGDHHGR
jgi:hypothetical protein